MGGCKEEERKRKGRGRGKDRVWETGTEMVMIGM